MASNAVTVSQLPQTNTVISTDRIVVLYNASGNTALGNTSTRTIAVNNFVNSISSSILVTAPVANTSNGIAGQIAHNSNTFYVCVANNTWAKVPLTLSW